MSFIIAEWNTHEIQLCPIHHPCDTRRNFSFDFNYFVFLRFGFNLFRCNGCENKLRRKPKKLFRNFRILEMSSSSRHFDVIVIDYIETKPKRNTKISLLPTI